MSDRVYTEADIHTLGKREIITSDIPFIAAYWTEASPEYLRGMGADHGKIPPAEYWHEALHAQIAAPYSEKKAYAIIWLYDGEPVGHCNINNIIFGEEAFMHLHIWKPEMRRKRIGARCVELSLPYFFVNFGLKRLYCEPYALNPGPNSLLPKVGFTFEKTHTCVPGAICFEQEVNRWVMTRGKFDELYGPYPQQLM